MDDLTLTSNPHRDDKVIDGCSIFGMMDTSGRRFSGTDITRAIANMHFRGNGLGGGFAAYGIYPDHSEYYAFHIMYLSPESREVTESFLKEKFHVFKAEPIPIQPTPVVANPPVTYRYFVEPRQSEPEGPSDDDYVVENVMAINSTIKNAFVFSSGKNMGVFKGVGYPEDISEYFGLKNYDAYLWTAHGRFPTNTPGWWGGAHPFSILDWTVVHNGEISSYGINRRHLEQYGYHCTMQTDTEVIAYAIDLLVRKHGLPMEVVSKILASPFWEHIVRAPKGLGLTYSALRKVYGSLLLNGPFTIIIAHQGEMIGLTDRIRLRPLTAASKRDIIFLSSEESAIRLISPDLDRVWAPMGGEPVIAKLKPAENKLPKTPRRSRNEVYY